MLGFRYFQFLWLNVIKKKATWIVGFAYLLIIALLLFIIPMTLDRSPFYLWTDAQVSVNLMVLYAGGLYSSILAIFIFRDFNENGTELLIFSKPISRKELTFYKFLCFFVMGLIFSIVVTIMGCAVFAFKNVELDDGLSLLLSLFFGNLILILSFGFLSVFVTLFLNKIWTNLINICIVVIFMVFHMVSTFTIKTPGQHISEDPTNSLVSFNYLTEEGKMNYGASLNNYKPYKYNDKDVPIAFQINNIKDVERVYADYDAKSKTEASNILDLVQQYDSLFNVGSLEERKQRNAFESFGNNRWFKYHINKQNLAYDKSTRPLGFISGVSKNWLPQPIDDVATYTKNLPVNLEYELNEKYVFLGKTQRDSQSVQIVDTSDKMYVGRSYPNFVKSGTERYYEPKELLFNDEQNKWLDKFLFSTEDPTNDFIGFLVNNKTMKKYNYYSSIGEVVSSQDENSFYSNYREKTTSKDGLYNYIHDLLIDAIENDVFPEFKEKPTAAELNVIVLKFKYNCFLELTKKINEDCQFESNIYSENQVFQNYDFVLAAPESSGGYGIPPSVIQNDIAHKGRPLNPGLEGPLGDSQDSNNESKNYFSNILLKNARAFLEEYVIQQENLGYTSIERGSKNNLKGWDREPDRYKVTLYTTKLPLYYTYLNTTFNFSVEAAFSTYQLWAIWGIITLLLMAISITIYYRTDFK